MTKKPRKPVDAPAPAAPAPAPAGWEPHTRFGVQRFDPSEAGRLVRLATVLRWLEAAHELPRAVALDHLCDRIPPNALQWCYQLQPTGYAVAVDPGCLFGYVTAERREEMQKARQQKEQQGVLRRNRGFVNNWDSQGPTWRRVAVKFLTELPEAAEPGVPALAKRIRSLWSSSKLRRKSTRDVLDDPEAAPLVALAIRLDKAGELWGYGQAAQATPEPAQPATWPELVAARKSKSGEPWTPEALQLLASEKAKRGAGAVASMAGELGVTAEAINGALRRTRKRQSATVTGRVVKFGSGAK